MEYLEVSVITTKDIYESVANLFWELGAGGVAVEDPSIITHHIEQGSWDAWEFPEKLLKSSNIVVKGYFAKDINLNKKLITFKESIEEFKLQFVGGQIEVSEAEVAEEDWATSWKEYYKPEKIGEKVVIKPSWEEYQANTGEIVVELDPGMAFGTGNHPTTAMCIKALEYSIFPGCKVLDVGTGSGVLAITATKLGAKQVLAIDNDPVSIDAAKENVHINSADDKVTVALGDLAKGVHEKADIVVANIIADIIIKLVPQVVGVTEKGSIFISSGIIKERLNDVVAAIEQSPFRIEKILEEGEWAAVIARKD